MKNKITTKDIFENESMNLFFMLCTYFLSVLVLYSISQIFNIINFTVIQIISIIVPIVLYMILDKNKIIKKIIITIFIYLFILLALPFIYNKTYDLTIDGNTYHKTAIAFIKNGWNPLYESARDFQKHNDDVIKISKEERQDLWIEHYPKATWILSANIYNMTGNIESGKCITLIFSIMLLIIAYNCLKKILDKKWTVIISALVVLNPIVLSQIFTYYVDGIMGIMFAIELLLLMTLNVKEKISIKFYIALTAILSIFVNLKFTGLLCAGVIAAVYYFYHLINNRKDKKELTTIFKRITIMFVIAFGVAVFLVGANSYVKNTIDHHMPLYPIMGKGKVDIITTMQPKSFNKKNDLTKFIISIYSKTENVTYENEPTLKLPIRLYRKELEELIIPDVRIGGFGPLFALVFTCSIILAIYPIYLIWKNEKENLKYVILPTISILASMILIGESWWARYIPQFYLIALGVLVLLIYIKKYCNNIILKIVRLLFLAIIGLNVLCFSYSVYYNLETFGKIRQDIKIMKNTENLKLKTSQDGLYGYYYTLRDNGVKYEQVSEIEEENIFYMYSWRVQVDKE